MVLEMNSYSSRINKQTETTESERSSNDLLHEGDNKSETKLSQNFTWWSLFGVSFGLTNSWLGVSSSLSTGIASGGPVLIIYGLIIGFVFSLAVAITLSELVTTYPNSGGPYYWTLKLAPNKSKRFLSYACGNINYFGALFTNASITSSVATSIMGVYCLLSPNFELKRWNIFITYEVLNLFITLFNIWNKVLPLCTSAALYVSIMAFLVTMITCLSCSYSNYQSADFIFADFANTTGWNSAGMAFIVGLVNPLWAYAGLDSATHMVDELGVSNSRVLIPRAIFGTVFLGFMTAFAYSISMFFCIKDSSAVVEAVLPILEIFYQATKSKPAAVLLQCLCILAGLFCNITANTWQARICWSFSHNNGLPGSRYWITVHDRLRLPVNAHLISNFLIAIIGCIFIGSSTAFNAIVTACISLLLVSYSIPTICLLIAGRSNISSETFKTGNIGLISNILTICWSGFCLVFLSFPYVLPATANSMNYVSVVYGIICIYIYLDWRIRKKVTDDELYLSIK